MQKQSKNWPGVQYPLKTTFDFILLLALAFLTEATEFSSASPIRSTEEDSSEASYESGSFVSVTSIRQETKSLHSILKFVNKNLMVSIYPIKQYSVCTLSKAFVSWGGCLCVGEVGVGDMYYVFCFLF